VLSFHQFFYKKTLVTRCTVGLGEEWCAIQESFFCLWKCLVSQLDRYRSSCKDLRRVYFESVYYTDLVVG
jgi:hypothetical protein